jgi:hypothetical protein
MIAPAGAEVALLCDKYMKRIYKWQLETKSVSIRRDICFRHMKTFGGDDIFIRYILINDVKESVTIITLQTTEYIFRFHQVWCIKRIQQYEEL